MQLGKEKASLRWNSALNACTVFSWSAAELDVGVPGEKSPQSSGPRGGRHRVKNSEYTCRPSN